MKKELLNIELESPNLDIATISAMAKASQKYYSPIILLKTIQAFECFRSGRTYDLYRYEFEIGGDEEK